MSHLVIPCNLSSTLSTPLSVENAVMSFEHTVMISHVFQMPVAPVGLLFADIWVMHHTHVSFQVVRAGWL